MEAFLDLLSSGKVHLAPLITHRFSVDEAHQAYQLISGKTGESFLGVLINYPEQVGTQATIRVAKADTKPLQPQASAGLRIGLLGAGNFAAGTLLPVLKGLSGVRLVGTCGATGPRSRRASEKFGFEYCTTDEDRVIRDPDVNTVAICTRHHLHASQTIAALRAGKHVFCEKPLCLSEVELSEVVSTYASGKAGQQLMVGFNRRFAPIARQMKEFFSDVSEPLAMHYRVNAGYVPPDHWVNDPEVGGGRILGEVCHFVDFLIFFAGSHPVEVRADSIANPGQYSGENVVISLRFANGSHGTISYLANGDRSFSKERVEVFGGGAVAVLEDFRRLETVRQRRTRMVRSRWRQDKGHRAEWQAFAKAVRSGGPSPIAFEDIVAATLTTLRIRDSISLGQAVTTDTNVFLHSIVERCSVA
jgi:predicted dehydrogenase